MEHCLVLLFFLFDVLGKFAIFDLYFLKGIFQLMVGNLSVTTDLFDDLGLGFDSKAIVILTNESGDVNKYMKPILHIANKVLPY